MSYKQKLHLARQFRSNPTKSEAILWNELRRKNFLELKFKRQYPILGFILDFYCHELKLAIEIDGEIHSQQKGYDILRQELIEKTGIKFYRISSKKVEYNLKQTLIQLEKFIKAQRNP